MKMAAGRLRPDVYGRCSAADRFNSPYPGDATDGVAGSNDGTTQPICRLVVRSGSRRMRRPALPPLPQRHEVQWQSRGLSAYALRSRLVKGI